jgi:hypothetical protein
MAQDIRVRRCHTLEKTMTKTLQAPPGYAALLKDIKERVRTAQVRAALAVNRELILLYWSIGRDILDRQKAEGWGTKVIERLAKDLGTEFPGIEGFSPRNLKYMRALLRRGRKRNLCNKLLQNCRGAIRLASWTASRTVPRGSGT